MILSLLLLLGGPLQHSGWPLETPLDRLLIVSVDGLRSDALVSGGPAALPALHRLLSGTSTLNARTDPDITVTLPNHVGMLTGQFLSGADGHRWSENIDPPPGKTLEQQAGRYLPGIFDVAHDHGLRTALFAGKSKFSLFDLSWDQAHGRPDRTGADHGRDKLDEYRFDEDPGRLTASARLALQAADRTLVFLHYPMPDLAGHSSGWDLSPDSPYMKAVAQVDAELEVLMAAIQAWTEDGQRIGVILTADHGGGSPLHGHSRGTGLWVNYIIPFLVWSPWLEGGQDLYAAFPQRWTDPSIRQPGIRGPQPVRNLDAAGIALELLGLPSLIPAAAEALVPKKSPSVAD
ncbi:MAG: alkaline phosphatase family protein [Planctomycetes bacterium]|nr:alkaline phosphatase family protein [Planctomycetota bacterium]MBL7009115.1 alkaline phosphatase family protein [Planctomycetota bacterium]